MNSFDTKLRYWENDPLHLKWKPFNGSPPLLRIKKEREERG
jgi:hypothetical protein